MGSYPGPFNLFLSVEPMLSPIILPENIEGVTQVIYGGETGSNARLCNYDWVEDLKALVSSYPPSPDFLLLCRAKHFVYNPLPLNKNDLLVHILARKGLLRFFRVS